VGKTLQDGDEVVLQRTDGAAVRCACQARQLGAHGDAPPAGQARTVVGWDTPLALSTSAEFPMEAAHGPGAVPWACTACFEPHAVGRLREALRLGLHGTQAELHELGLERPSVIHLSGPAGRAPLLPRTPRAMHALHAPRLAGGAPGGGKTTLLRALAAELRAPVFAVLQRGALPADLLRPAHRAAPRHAPATRPAGAPGPWLDLNDLPPSDWRCMRCPPPLPPRARPRVLCSSCAARPTLHAQRVRLFMRSASDGRDGARQGRGGGAG